jgi:hypothetical protein
MKRTCSMGIPCPHEAVSPNQAWLGQMLQRWKQMNTPAEPLFSRLHQSGLSVTWPTLLPCCDHQPLLQLQAMAVHTSMPGVILPPCPAMATLQFLPRAACSSSLDPSYGLSSTVAAEGVMKVTPDQYDDNQE